MTETLHRNRVLFGTPLELGLRVLFLFERLSGPVDLDRLGALDYLLVHSADADGPPSLHPPVPHRSGELLVKRPVLAAAVRALARRGLLSVDLSTSGVRYGHSELTSPFLAYLTSEYATQLRERAAWVAATYTALGDEGLDALIANGLGRWGGEFMTEALVRHVGT